MLVYQQSRIPESNPESLLLIIISFENHKDVRNESFNLCTAENVY